MRVARFDLPFPPSVNTMFRNVPNRGRVKTAAYKKWAKAATPLVTAAWLTMPEECDCEVWIALHRPDNRLRDVDNYVKAILDCLTGIVFKDDSQVQWVTVFWSSDPAGEGATVTVRPFDESRAARAMGRAA